MPLFEYKALDNRGRKKNGLLDAATAQAAKERLRGQGLFVVAIGAESAPEKTRESRQLSLFTRVSRSDLAAVTNQMATLFRAGLPVVSALEVLIDQMEKPAVRKVLSGVRNAVSEGSSLNEAFSLYPAVFPPMYIQMCRAGEEGGFLGEIMNRLSATLEKEANLRGKVLGAMIYPIFMTIAGSILLMVLLTYVVPQIVGIFDDYGHGLPLPTQILLAVSGFLSAYWVGLVLMMSALAGSYVWAARSNRFGMAIDRMKLKLPLFGALTMKMAVVRFSHVLGTLLTSGVPLMRSLDVTSAVMGNRVLAGAVQGAATAVSRGSSLADSLRAAGVFPPILARVVAVGEQSGELPNMLVDVANSYEEEVSRATTALTALLGPVLILVMAAVVLFVVLSILLPIFEMNQLIKAR
jgi:general secretion pathway protein F